ncbi:hypothetical protein FQN60_007946 [Etheostoma spectabile]|uniref:T-box domain-containing protein n=1 Tax=Etheostoma spectabile TaxID=54343 RepID=A0A5J5CXW4_9PERO|nr:hypothetical protein FQN60_007946 [Etheostoma spectabile]
MQHISDSKSHLSMPRSPAADSYQQGCIRMTLENADLWKSFHSMGTEMIITKHGRRMFPHCSISLSGLQPFAYYVIMMDMVPADSFKYKWKTEQWEVAGKSEPQPPCRIYVHPDSPAPGCHWMKQSLSFLKMKLTNNTLDQHGHIILHSMHRYYPRFHITQADSPYTVRWGPFQTFSFPETTFTAVTAYQNPKVIKLYSSVIQIEVLLQKELHWIENLFASVIKVNLQRMPSLSQSVEAGKDHASTQQPFKRGNLSAVELDPSESLHAEPLELHEYDYSCEEQMVPASVPHQPYRAQEYSRYPLPSNDVDGAHNLVHPPPHPHHHSHATDWSQYPLFPYSCW